jgi:hypothetical protein
VAGDEVRDEYGFIVRRYGAIHVRASSLGVGAGFLQLRVKFPDAIRAQAVGEGDRRADQVARAGAFIHEAEELDREFSFVGGSERFFCLRLYLAGLGRGWRFPQRPITGWCRGLENAD